MATISARAASLVDKALSIFRNIDGSSGFGTLFRTAQTDIATAQTNITTLQSQTGKLGATTVLVWGYAGKRTVAQTNLLSPTKGLALHMADAGTLTTGSLAVSAGDLVEYSGSAWVKLVSGVGGYPPAGTVALVLSSGTLYAPLTDDTDEGKVATFDGTSFTGTLTTPTAGDMRRVVAGGAGASVYNKALFVYVASSFWVAPLIKYTDTTHNKVQAASLSTQEAIQDLNNAFWYDRGGGIAATSQRLTNSNTETAYSGTLALGANVLAADVVYEADAVVYVVGVTGTPTFTMTMQMDGVDAASLASSTAVAAGDVLKINMKIRTLAAGATGLVIIEFRTMKILAGTATVVHSGMVNAAFDTTATHTIGITGQWSAASTSNIADLRLLADSRRTAAPVT